MSQSFLNNDCQLQNMNYYFKLNYYFYKVYIYIVILLLSGKIKKTKITLLNYILIAQ